jgi:superfamily II DNA helicase RecQ
MGIEAGKSILFILPVLYSIGVTVVVILLISLRDNLKDYCDKVGIKYIK